MDLRSLPDGLSASDRVTERRSRIERELNLDLNGVRTSPNRIGHAEERNCEQMFGTVPLPVGYAGPLTVMMSDKTDTTVHLPLATTEGALVASVNRGCKALTTSGGVRTSSIQHGISRSIALKRLAISGQRLADIEKRSDEWRAVAEGTSDHLKIVRHEIDETDEYVFLTLYANTDEAMGMNMITIAAQAVGEWIEANIGGCTFVTVAGNVDSDKKPSKRTHDRGRGIEVTAEAMLTTAVITDILKSTPEAMLEVAKAKLDVGSTLAGAIGKNLHAANIIAALYLATGQDAAHVVEGSLADTTVAKVKEGLRVSVRLPALIIGVRGGGTTLPAQSHCLKLLLNQKTSLHPCLQVAESIGAAVLAGEVSLMAAQAGHQLTQAHKNLGRIRQK